ncbi:uncharacterized protein LOC114531808 [Dendronephthya gigantea]|uniref:uncharacterized protein LOC114531808 n=1 Tax=Dendronephthya gigantea TaxID=151771 RepID=UPI00106A7A80|nr:uncharacterized protein LOC114531808 [Dendronephthya gigantea]XP_028409227.1 uncharacterized protein LOC114531808 [Dendronephthya gigantea]
MYSVNIFIFSSVALMCFSTMNAKLSKRSPDLPCNEENFGQRKLIKDEDGRENFFICAKRNGVYMLKKETTEAKVRDDNDNYDMMDDILLKREDASKFFERNRRGLNHECYAECCNWEEVREHYEHDIAAAQNYWNKYNHWKSSNGHC